MSTFLLEDLPMTEIITERKERILDAPILSFNLLSEIEKMKTEIAWKMGTQDSKTILRNPSMKIVLIGMHPGAKIMPHQSEGVSSFLILEGKIKIRTEKETLNLNEGELLTLHEKIMYEVRAMEESFVLHTISLDKFNQGE